MYDRYHGDIGSEVEHTNKKQRHYDDVVGTKNQQQFLYFTFRCYAKFYNQALQADA